MKAFLAAVVVTVLIAIAAAIGLEQLDWSSATVLASPNVRL
jgi:hypothetical protein